MQIPNRHKRDTQRADDSFMTPMIDVVFLLLIFFVCASVGQVRESNLPTPLSGGSVETTQPVDQPRPTEQVWLKLFRKDAGGNRVTRAELNGSEYDDWNELKTNLRAIASLKSDIPVILDIEQDVPVGDLIDIYDTCKGADFHDVKFATQSRPKPN